MTSDWCSGARLAQVSQGCNRMWESAGAWAWEGTVGAVGCRRAWLSGGGQGRGVVSQQHRNPAYLDNVWGGVHHVVEQLEGERGDGWSTTSKSWLWHTNQSPTRNVS